MKSFCIVLPEAPERTAEAKAHFAEIGLPDVTFFDGIHAERFGLKTVFPYERDNPGTGFNMGFKCVGIWLSHYMLWKALQMQPDEHFLILESDAKFLPGWEKRLAAALLDVPVDYDMLYVGSCCCTGLPTTQIKGEVFRVEWPVCLHAYIVARKAIQTILSSQRRCYAPIDISLALHTHPKLKVFTVLPRIVDQFNCHIEP